MSTSSQGVHLRQFVGVEPGATRDIATPIPDPVFNIDAINTRRAEPRNTPTMINAAFNHNNFWDRRARNIFNGCQRARGRRFGGAGVPRNRPQSDRAASSSASTTRAWRRRRSVRR